MSRRIPLLHVDAFTAERFRGNPAAVCLLPNEADPAWMQAVAAEMNLSETGFVTRRGDNEFSIRWFTPTVEVPLCGHGTLASAHALWEENVAAPEGPITFHAPKGRLSARREGDWICLNFPTLRTQESQPPAGLAEALGCTPVSVHHSSLPTFLAELDSERTVRLLQVDLGRLQNAGVGQCIVTARGDEDSCDFVSRFFAPGLGIDEDPVTGAAHCVLAPFWSERLGKTEMVGHQVSKRGGVVQVRLHGERVELLGQAVTVVRGDLILHEERNARTPTDGPNTEPVSIAANDRIRLRPTSIDDLEFVIRAEKHPDNAAFIRQWSERQHRSAIEDDGMAHWIVEPEPKGAPLGYVILCGLGNADCSVELKRIVVVEKGRGFGRDAFRLVKKVVFEQLEVHRLWLEVVEGNTRARQLYEAEGFFVEGIHREAVKIRDRFESVVVMSMLETEYEMPVQDGA